MTATGEEALEFVRDRVMHVVGHELRTPITTVRGLAELLATATDEEIRDTLAPALLRNARRAEHLINDLLLAAEIDTVRPTDGPQRLDLHDVVLDALDGSDMRVDGRPAGEVMGHRPSIVRAVKHLIDNARAYTDGEPLMRFEADRDSVALVVVTPVDGEIADLELSFELFFRGEAAVTRAPGLGVGLAAARALAQVDEGDVTISQTGGCVETRLQLRRAR